MVLRFFGLHPFHVTGFPYIQSVLEPIAKPSHTEASVQYKVHGIYEGSAGFLS